MCIYIIKSSKKAKIEDAFNFKNQNQNFSDNFTFFMHAYKMTTNSMISRLTYLTNEEK